jgi:hypothetical protein
MRPAVRTIPEQTMTNSTVVENHSTKSAAMENHPTRVGNPNQAWWPMGSMRNTTRVIHLFKDPPAALFSGVDFIYPEPLYRITRLLRLWKTKGSNRRNSKSPQVSTLKEVRPYPQIAYDQFPQSNH